MLTPLSYSLTTLSSLASEKAALEKSPEEASLKKLLNEWREGSENQSDTIDKIESLLERASKYNVEATLSFKELRRPIVTKFIQCFKEKGTELNLNGCKGIEKLPPEVWSYFPGLKKLYLKENGLNALPEGLGGLKFLQELHIEKNNLTELPEWFGELSQLRLLDFTKNSLETLPNEFGQLRKLSKLILKNNKFKEIPQVIIELPKLEELNFRKNFLEALPMYFGQMEELRILNLSVNEFKVFPNALGRLKKLKLLNFSNNSLEEFPFGLTSLLSLEEFIIGWQNIIKPFNLPEEIFGFIRDNEEPKLGKFIKQSTDSLDTKGYFSLGLNSISYKNQTDSSSDNLSDGKDTAYLGSSDTSEPDIF
jgi:Leucine-rich repeat (LRR) protein